MDSNIDTISNRDNYASLVTERNKLSVSSPKNEDTKPSPPVVYFLGSKPSNHLSDNPISSLPNTINTPLSKSTEELSLAGTSLAAQTYHHRRHLPEDQHHYYYSSVPSSSSSTVAPLSSSSSFSTATVPNDSYSQRNTGDGSLAAQTYKRVKHQENNDRSNIHIHDTPWYTVSSLSFSSSSSSSSASSSSSVPPVQPTFITTVPVHYPSSIPVSSSSSGDGSLAAQTYRKRPTLSTGDHSLLSSASASSSVPCSTTTTRPSSSSTTTTTTTETSSDPSVSTTTVRLPMAVIPGDEDYREALVSVHRDRSNLPVVVDVVPEGRVSSSVSSSSIYSRSSSVLPSSFSTDALDLPIDNTRLFAFIDIALENMDSSSPASLSIENNVSPYSSRLSTTNSSMTPSSSVSNASPSTGTGTAEKRRRTTLPKPAAHLPVALYTTLTGVNIPSTNICEICQKIFRSQSDLISHRRTHSGDKPLVCSFPNCGKRFAHVSNLRVHERGHSGERPHVCPERGCGKAFRHPSSRDDHYATVHKGMRQYICTLCGKDFTASANLSRHKRSVHQLQNNPHRTVPMNVSAADPSSPSSAAHYSSTTVDGNLNDDDNDIIEDESADEDEELGPDSNAVMHETV